MTFIGSKAMAQSVTILMAALRYLRDVSALLEVNAINADSPDDGSGHAARVIEINCRRPEDLNR